MKRHAKRALRSAFRLDDPELRLENLCHDERANWLASRIGLPTTGSTMVNKHGIQWVVQNHATVPTIGTLQRWRNGNIDPEIDLYPVVTPQNFSAGLMEFFNAIDRCTTKTFAFLDTQPGQRKGAHVPSCTSIDTLGNPATNILYVDAARIHESIVAHELGHAWVQYVDECEDLRTMEEASDPQRMRHVNFVQSFVLDVRVNQLIRDKGFDMEPIESDRSMAMDQLAQALRKDYLPEYRAEEAFMSLIVADQILQRDLGGISELARFDSSLASIRASSPPVAALAEKMADSVRRNGYGSQASIVAAIDECLLASFEHCGDRFDIDKELVLVTSDEPDIDKFPYWLPALPPKLKCRVGRHMAKNDIPLDWAHSMGQTLTGRTRVTFYSPEGAKSEVIVPHRIGSPTPYLGMHENSAEVLEVKRQNGERRKFAIDTGMPEPVKQKETMEFNRANRVVPANETQFSSYQRNQPGRPYMAGLGRFLTAARLAEQLAGEQPYGYAFNSPVTYTDPRGLSPGSDLAGCINAWASLGYSRRSACAYCKTAQGYQGCFNCDSQSNAGAPIVPGQRTRGYGNPIIDPNLLSSVFRYDTAYPNMNYTICEGTCDWSVRQKVNSVNSKMLYQTCIAACNALRQGGCELLWIRCFKMGNTYQADNCVAFYNFVCAGE